MTVTEMGDEREHDAFRELPLYQKGWRIGGEWHKMRLEW